MNDFFIWLYQTFHGLQDDPLWDEVYVMVGIISLIFTLCLVAIFYHLLNRYFINWFKISRWFLILFLNSLILSILALIISFNIIEPVEIGSEFYSFPITNFIISALFYSLFSFFICFNSPFAKYTPYKFYSKIRKDKNG